MYSTTETKNIAENDYAIIRNKNGILIGEYKPVRIDLEGAKQVVLGRKSIQRGVAMPILVDGRKVREINKPARDYFGSDEGAELLTAAAIYVESALTKHLANFVLSISFRKRKMPMRMFTDRESAIKWLQQYKPSD